jgi:hypothetical protein
MDREVAQVLARLGDREELEDHNLQESQRLYNEFTQYNEEEVHDDESPVFSKYLAANLDSIRSMTNFTSVEFDTLWGNIESDVVVLWTQGRGRKHKTSAKDAFFMALTVLKHYDAWFKHASDFHMQPTSFQKMMDKVC